MTRFVDLVVCGLALACGPMAIGQQSSGGAAGSASGTTQQAKAPLRIDGIATPSARFPAAWYPTDREVGYGALPVKGAPYSGDFMMSITVAASNGQQTRVESERSRHYRDSAGRTRTEEVAPAHTPRRNEGPIALRKIAVVDPVSHCAFTWDEPGPGEAANGPAVPTATVGCDPVKLHYGAEWSDEPDDPSMGAEGQVAKEERKGNETIRDQPLGTKTVNGIAALGMRRTIILDDGKTLDGKLVPSTTVSETWWSPVIREVVSMGTVDASEPMPRFDLVNVTASEPDPGLFYPPANFRIVKR